MEQRSKTLVFLWIIPVQKKYAIFKNYYFFTAMFLLLTRVFFLALDVLGGYNGTIFAYGQTSSGKTHTMEVKHCLIIQKVFLWHTLTCSQTHTRTHSHLLLYFSVECVFLWLPCQCLCLHHGHQSLSLFPSPCVETNLTTLSGKQPCSVWSQKPLCSLFFYYSLHLIHPRVCTYPALQ